MVAGGFLLIRILEMEKEVTFCDTCSAFFISDDFRSHHLSKGHTNKAVQYMHQECCLSIENFLPGTKVENIYDYFKHFGAVKAVVMPNKMKMAILEFYSKDSVDAVFNSKKSHVLSGIILVVGSYDPKYNGGKPLESPAPYHLLVEHLRNFKRVEDQMMYLSSSLLLSEEQFRMRMDLLFSLKRMLTPFFPECSLHLFGSTVNGYGIKGCDVDILFQTGSVMPVESAGSMLERQQILSMSPTVGAVKNRTFSLDSLHQLPRVVQLHFIMRVLRSRNSGFHTVRFVNSKICPVVKLVSKHYGLNCDISNGNRLALYNTSLLSLYGKLDPRVVPLMTVLRCWGKKFGYISTRSFSSYAFSLLVIFFLQTRTPAVLPSVNFLRYKAVSQISEDGFDCSFCSDVDKIGRSKNLQTLGNLLMEFFEYYGNFDFEKFAVVPLHGHSEIYPILVRHLDYSQLGHTHTKYVICESKDEKKKADAVYIQDPFCVSRNVASSVKEELLCNMKCHFQRIVREHQDYSHTTAKLQQVKSCNTSDSQFWGIPQLFDVIPEFVIVSAAKKQLHRFLEIELSTTVMNSVKKKYGIKCTHCVNMKEICVPIVVNTAIELMSCGLLFTLRVHDTSSYTELLEKTKNLRTDCTCETSQGFINSNADLMPKVPSACGFSKQVPFVTIEITTFHKTWKNREKYNAQCFRGDMCPLEYERYISQKITTTSRMKKPVELKCEFYESNQKFNSLILIKVAPMERKACWRQISRFLTSYLPKGIEDML